MNLSPTRRLYLDDGHTLRISAQVVAVRDSALALDRSCFYPGGGGQPPDEGTMRLHTGATLQLNRAHADDQGVVWHVTSSALPDNLVGAAVEIEVDRARRNALARHHTVLHILNTIALRDYGGWITGAQIAPDYSRIDFKLDGLPPEMRSDLERKVNEVIAAARPVRSYTLSEQEFGASDGLLRTLEVKPPVHNGRVRIVAIEGFDAQACGGTHVSNTGEIGCFRIERAENKGKINKRLYVRLAPTSDC
jgi:misacylated tRNA(Ala) deacylase